MLLQRIGRAFFRRPMSRGQHLQALGNRLQRRVMPHFSGQEQLRAMAQGGLHL